MYEYKVKLEKHLISDENIVFTDPSSIADFLINTCKIREEAQELVYLLILNDHLDLIGMQLISLGGINYAQIDPIVLFRPIFLSASSRFIIAHNHIGAPAYPSKEDRALTNDVLKMAHVLHLSFLDHIIIGQEDTYSFNDNNLLKGVTDES